MPRGKTNGINYGYRVPFVIWFPEMYKHLSPWGTAGIVTDELIDFEDLAPTLISLANGEIPDYLKGRVLLGENRSEPADHLILSNDRSDNGIDMVRTVTDGKYIYSRNFMPFMPEARYIRYMEIGDIKQVMRKELAEGKLNPLQKSLFEPRPAEFLFDIENDLWETKNLVDNPEYKKVLEKMRNQLDKEILNARDIMFLPEYEIRLISKSETPYEFRMDKKHYPLKEIYAAASLSGKRGVEIAKQQINLLKDKNDIVRYWAAIGLRCQNPKILQPFQNEIIAAINDDYPPVAVTAAAISYQNFKSQDAENKLNKFIKTENPDIALMAVNYLLYVDNKAPFIETVKTVHKMPDRVYNVKAACVDFLGSIGLVPNNYSNRK
jgi:hypothetical protein